MGRPRIYSRNEDYFAIPNLENCYWAGFIAADGCILDIVGSNKLTITLGIKDEQHLFNMKSALNYNGPISISNSIDKKNGHISYKKKLSIVSNKICQDLLNNWNIVPRKTHTLLPPNLNDKNLNLAYIKGFIDGDGHVKLTTRTFIVKGKTYTYNVPTIEITDGSIQLLTWIQEYINYNVVSNNAKIHKKSKKNAYRYRLSGKRALDFLKILKNLNTPSLDRKWDWI